MKEKGFTLIELLAVIVILAVIVLIATPLIMGVIDEAKDGANKRSVQSIRDGAETFLLSKKTLDGNYSFNMNDYTFKGNQFGKGTDDERINIVFNDQDEASVAVYENNKCYYILAGSNEVLSIEVNNKGECISKIGDSLLPEIISITPNTTDWVLSGIVLTVEAKDDSGIKAYSFDNGITWQDSNVSPVYNVAGEINIKVKDYADNITSTTVNIESRTEYGYQEVTQWDSEYDLTKPSDGYYKTKNQYQLSYQVDEWIQENPGKGGTEYSGIQSSNGNMVNNQLTKHIYFGKTVRNIVGTYTPYSVRYENPSNQYSWNFTLLTPPGDSTSRYVGDNTNTRYNFPKNTTPVTEFSYIIKANGRPSSAYEADVAWNISSWEYLSHKTLMTDWQDSNVDIPEGTFVGIANTREVYAKALSWGPSMGWNPDTPYTQTTSVKPVTRTTIHFVS